MFNVVDVFCMAVSASLVSIQGSLKKGNSASYVKLHNHHVTGRPNGGESEIPSMQYDLI